MEPGILQVLVRRVSVFSAASDYLLKRHDSWCTTESYEVNEMWKSLWGLKCVLSVYSTLIVKYKVQEKKPCQAW